MIKVKLYAILAERSRTGKKDFEIPIDGSLRVVELARSELPEGWEEFLMAIVNGSHVDMDHELKDGDMVELMLAMQGG